MAKDDSRATAMEFVDTRRHIFGFLTGGGSDS